MGRFYKRTIKQAIAKGQRKISWLRFWFCAKERGLLKYTIKEGLKLVLINGFVKNNNGNNLDRYALQLSISCLICFLILMVFWKIPGGLICGLHKQGNADISLLH